ncbi:family 78 glycoside hydrolase catalytic domain [Quadrisphaera sp. KR29]|uniref:family 78 glycoside hydrolase catalytic domain n=1 Tax=Quadrisphaera sp. KR29 TaxID=3461391 RepID=UPI004044859E
MSPRPSQPRFEHHEPGRLGIGERAPRLSWMIPEAPQNWAQGGAEVDLQVTSGLGEVRTSTHQLTGPDQVLVAWPARPLTSRDRVSARVRVRGAEPGSPWGEWSEASTVEVGLIEEQDWTAQFVGPRAQRASTEPGAAERPPARVRHAFTLPAGITSARLHLSGHGLVEAEINGRRVGDEELTPGWTSYAHRLRWATFDVSEHVVPGDNAIGVWLADGWWRGRIGFEGGRTDLWGTDLAALVQLEALTDAGELVRVVSDDSWMVGPSPTSQASLYDGEHTDLRRADPSWSTPGFLAPGWEPVHTAELDASVLVAPTGPPVRCTEELTPVSVTRRGPDRWVLDFGQNHSGRLRLRLEGPEGTVVTLRHAEVLQDEELCTRPLRQAAATDRVVLPGGPVTWEPRATIHGYRYAEVSGWPGEIHAGDVVSRVLHTDMDRRGWFECDDTDLNRLHENVVWSLRSNFVDLPTDCPQRDERLGWTGDLQVFAPTAAYLYDVTGMLASWLQDLAAEQHERGTVPFYVPFMQLGIFSADMPPAAVWGDVAVLTPADLHLATGDVGLLRRQWPSARDWLERVAATAGEDLIADKCFQFGDWLDPAAPPDQPWAATTPAPLVATAYFAHSARRLATIARVIGQDEDAERYAGLAERVVAAYQERFLPGGQLQAVTQTALALTTAFDLWPDAASAQAGALALAQLVQDGDYTVATGFAGTPAVADALTIGGRVQDAFALVQSHQSPSWLSMVDRGATSIWERWDSLLADGTVNAGEMTSFNHYALGAVAGWLHRVVGGLAPLEPGYRQLLVAPRPGGTVRYARAKHLTPYGEAKVTWRVEGATLEVEVNVPVGTTAVLDLPGGQVEEIGHGQHHRSLLI